MYKQYLFLIINDNIVYFKQSNHKYIILVKIHNISKKYHQHES